MTPDSNYIEVAIALPIENTFTYAAPEILSSFVSVGKRVLIPFGRRRITGYVLGMPETTAQSEVKLILDVLDENPLFPPTMTPFFRWISDYYMYPIGLVIQCALPGGINPSDFATAAMTEAGKEALSKENLTPLKREILERLTSEPLKLKSLAKILNKEIPYSLLRDMEKQGWLMRQNVLESGKTKARTERYVSITASDISPEKLSEPSKRIIEILQSEQEVSVRQLKAEVPTAANLIKSLESKGLVSIFEKRVYRDPFGEVIEPDKPPCLTEEQEKVISEITAAMEKGFAAYLLSGVTGSGKTEVYMRLAAEVIRHGKSVLILVPEIALISQTERRFRARFGECVAVLHSGLSAGERYDQWTRILNKEAKIAVGARSAVFAPFDRIGLLVVDEEHDSSYKQEHDLLYNARDLAVVRAKLDCGVALLGSATPSVQSSYNVEIGKFTEVRLTRRVESRPLPEIQVVDLRKNRDERGIRHFISPELYAAMQETLAHKEQVLLFLNRRGFAGFPVCAACGDPLRCNNCDITLTLHRAANVYKCHYCGFTLSAASKCPTCDSSGIKLLGLGTERVEAALNKLFPESKIARMDRDTVSRKGDLLQILRSVRNREVDMLIGTQMVAKGHDFPNITLVGIICADLSLCFPDFRAGERAFQLMAQVAGRAGRGDVPGRVILQTYNPTHFSIVAAKHQDFRRFYEREIGFRKALKYPPVSRMIQLKISGMKKDKTFEFARETGEICRRLQSSDPDFSGYIIIMGPVEAAVSKLAKHYRWQILLKGLKAGILHRFVHRLKNEHSQIFHNRDVRIVADVDPISMF
ncbi:MAG: primosomal protein N' [Desulfobacteraceae bacterium IS3]|nr:MAG: primosomal protein N' [Desulfobacteraceae bacterium IS3]